MEGAVLAGLLIMAGPFSTGKKLATVGAAPTSCVKLDAWSEMAFWPPPLLAMPPVCPFGPSCSAQRLILWVPAAFPPFKPEYRRMFLSLAAGACMPCLASRPMVANGTSEILSLDPSEEAAAAVASLTLSASSDADAVEVVDAGSAAGAPPAMTVGPFVLLELLAADLMLAAGRKTMFVQLAPAAVGSLVPLHEAGCGGCSSGSTALEG